MYIEDYEQVSSLNALSGIESIKYQCLILLPCIYEEITDFAIYTTMCKILENAKSVKNWISSPSWI